MEVELFDGRGKEGGDGRGQWFGCFMSEEVGNVCENGGVGGGKVVV